MALNYCITIHVEEALRQYLEDESEKSLLDQKAKDLGLSTITKTI
jgi:hypothetical protein